MCYIVRLARQSIAMELPLPGPCSGCSHSLWYKHGTGTRRIVDCCEVTRVPTQRYRCQVCRKTKTVKPLGVDGTYRSQSFQVLNMVLYSLGLSLRNMEAVLRRFGFEVDHATCWRDVQRLAPTVQRPGSAGAVRAVYLDEANARKEKEAEPVKVIIDLKGRLLPLAVTGPGFDWAAWRAKLSAWDVEVVETSDV